MSNNNVFTLEKTLLTKDEVDEIKNRKDFCHFDWTFVQVSDILYMVIYNPFKLQQARVK